MHHQEEGIPFAYHYHMADQVDMNDSGKGADSTAVPPMRAEGEVHKGIREAAIGILDGFHVRTYLLALLYAGAGPAVAAAGGM